MVSDISLAFDALSLPILEPLTPSKLEKLIKITGAAIYCGFWGAVSVNSASSSATTVSPRNSSTQPATMLFGPNTLNKDEDLDGLAISLVETVLELFSYVTDTIKKSTRTGGHVS